MLGSKSVVYRYMPPKNNYNRGNNHNNYTRVDINEIKNKISSNLKKSHLVMSKQKFDDENHPDVTYDFSLKVSQDGLKSFEVPDKHYGDIFSLYISVPIKEEEERKRQEEIKKRQEELQRQQELENQRKQAQELMKKKNKPKTSKSKGSATLQKKTREFLDESDLSEFLNSIPEKDKYVFDTLIKQVKKEGKFEPRFMNNIRKTNIWKQDPPVESMNQKLENRKWGVKELPEKGDKGYRGGYNNRRGQDRNDRKRNTVYEKRNNDGGFARKEMTEEQKRMKEEASQLHDKLKQRNELKQGLELEIKLIMNKITPSTYNNLKNKLVEIMQKNEYGYHVLQLISLEIYNKAWFEKKYTTMYSELCAYLVKKESAYISKLFDSDKDKFKEIYIKKSEDKQGKSKEIKKVTSKNAKKYSVLKSELLNYWREHIHKLGSELEVDEDDSDRDEKIAKHKDKIMGNVRFIGTLYTIDLLQADLTLNIISSYLISPWKIELENGQELGSNHLDLIEASCCILEQIGSSMEKYISDTE